MCYDVSLMNDAKRILDSFPEVINEIASGSYLFPVDHVQGIGVFPLYPVLYRNRDDHSIHLKEMEWSVIEFYIKEEPGFAKRNGMLNIRSERILDDVKSYWYKIRNRRCLIPVTGIFEHRAVKGWKKKVPYLVKMKNEPVFFLPGLYSVAHIVDKETGELQERWTFGMVTRSANHLMSRIHNSGEHKNRMPLFLPFTKSLKFLDEDLNESEYRDILNYKINDEDLSYCTVYTLRGTKSVSDEQRLKTDYYEWKDLPALGVGDPE